MFILLEITSSETTYPPEEGDSTGNYQLTDEESTQAGDSARFYQLNSHSLRLIRSKCAENPPNGNNSGISSCKSSLLPMPFNEKLNMKTSLK
jgi:hypothetical protein